MNAIYDQPGYQLRFSDDGALLLCIGEAVTLLDAKKRTWLWSSRHLKNPSEGSFSPDGRMLVVKNTSGQILVLKTRTGEVLLDLKNSAEGEGCEVHFSPDGKEIIDGSWSGSIFARNCRTGALRFRKEFALEMIERITHDALRRKWLIVQHPKQNPDLPPSKKPSKAYLRILEWPFFSKPDQTHTPVKHIGEATLHPNGETYCYAQTLPTRRLFVASTSKHAVLARTPPIKDDRIRELAWSPDGQIIAAVQKDAGFVFYRASDLAVVGTIPAKYASCVAFRPNADEIALGTWNEIAVVELQDALMGSFRFA